MTMWRKKKMNLRPPYSSFIRCIKFFLLFFIYYIITKKRAVQVEKHLFGGKDL